MTITRDSKGAEAWWGKDEHNTENGDRLDEEDKGDRGRGFTEQVVGIR